MITCITLILYALVYFFQLDGMMPYNVVNVMQSTTIVLLHYAIINVIISCNVINVEQCTIIVLLSSIYMWVHKDYEQNVTTFCTDKLITI